MITEFSEALLNCVAGVSDNFFLKVPIGIGIFVHNFLAIAICTSISWEFLFR